MASDSFIQALLKDRVRQQKVMAPSQLGTGAMSARPQAPVNAPVNPTPVVPEITQPEVKPLEAIASSGLPPIKQNNLNELIGQLNSMVDAQSGLSDKDFYEQTGRFPSAIDKSMMEAKRRFLMERGKLPTPTELIQEAQRGLMFGNSDINSLA